MIVRLLQQRFLQARLHLEFLTTKTTLRKLKDALTALPEGLNDTYDKTMERINSQYPDQATLAKKVLCWLFYAYQPLTMLVVQHAVSVEIGDRNLDDENSTLQRLGCTLRCECACHKAYHYNTPHPLESFIGILSVQCPYYSTRHDRCNLRSCRRRTDFALRAVYHFP